MPEMYQGGHLAVFRGMTPQPYELEVEVVAHDGSLELPQLGEFLLIAMTDSEAAVARVTHCFPCGPIATHQGETYLAEIGKSGTPIPAAVKRLVLRFSLRMQLLGRLQQSANGFEFKVGIRQLSQVGSKVCRPSLAALQFLCNVGLEQSEESGTHQPHPVPFGHLVLGDQENAEVEIKFDINRLKRKRTFVFARAGYGKSNLIKYLISKLYASQPEVGLLVLDPEGEYAVRNSTVPGLADLPNLREKIDVYTQRTGDEYVGIKRGPVYLDFGALSGEVILNAFIPPEKHTQVWANLIRAASNRQLRQVIDLLNEHRFRTLDEDLGRALGYKPRASKDSGGGDVSLGAIRNNLVPYIHRLHRKEGISARSVTERLRAGGIVIVDTSLLASDHARAISEILLQSIFMKNVRAFTDASEENRVPCIAVLEEAQTILGNHHFSETSIFVRWVKEGRKYGLGSILITQQPGAISEQILSQGDNFFVMHLLNQGDLDALQRVNAHYGPDILRQLRSEPIKGNCYFWSAPDQPYVLAARVHNFDREAHRPPPATASAVAPLPVFTSAPIPPPPEITLEELDSPASASLAQQQRERIRTAIARDRRVHVFETDGGRYAVSIRWLALSVGLDESALIEVLSEQELEICFAWVNHREHRVVVFPQHSCPLDGKDTHGRVSLVGATAIKTPSSTDPSPCP